MKALKWVRNPGKSEKPKNPDKMVWLMFRHEERTTREPVRAGGYNWKDRGLPFDIIAAAEPID